MTFSIVARDGEHWGVAVASKFLAVGAFVPAARAGVGAVATQAAANLTYRPDGLRLLTEGGGYGGGSDVLVDLRVDDHTDPVLELGRLVDLHDLYFGKPEHTLPLEGALAQEVSDRLAALGYPSLDDWAGVENYEERMVE